MSDSFMYYRCKKEISMPESKNIRLYRESVKK